jgi:uncharacterized phiE125 gp8 family phage protein
MSAFYYPVDTTATEILSLTAAKKQLKMEDLGDHDDTIIQECIDAAVEEAENYIGAAIYQQKYKIHATEWLHNYEFLKQKITSLDKITYKLAVGEPVELAGETLTAFAELLAVDKYASIIFIKDIDDAPILKEEINDAVVLEITTGYAAGDVPKSIIQAIKLITTDNYDVRNNRKSQGYTAAHAKLEPYKYYANKD